MKKRPRHIPIASAMMLRTDDFKLPKFVNESLTHWRSGNKFGRSPGGRTD